MAYLPTNHRVHAFTASMAKRVIVSGQKPVYGGRKKVVGKGLLFKELMRQVVTDSINREPRFANFLGQCLLRTEIIRMNMEYFS